MGKQNAPLLAWNRGIVSEKALGRVDVKRIAWSAAQQNNWMASKLGSMMLRPGLGYLLNTSDSRPKYLPFVFAIDDTALIELTNGEAKIIVDDARLTFAAVTAAVTNGDMSPDIANWTDADDSGAVSAHAGSSGGVVSLSDRTIYDVKVDGTATAKYKLDADGSAYTMRNYYDGGIYQVVAGEWKLSGAAADYEHYAEHVSGPALTSGTLNTWQGGGTDREWVKSRSTAGTDTTVLRVKTRLTAGGDPLATALITLKATRQSSGGGGGGYITP